MCCMKAVNRTLAVEEAVERRGQTLLALAPPNAHCFHEIAPRQPQTVGSVDQRRLPKRRVAGALQVLQQLSGLKATRLVRSDELQVDASYVTGDEWRLAPCQAQRRPQQQWPGRMSVRQPVEHSESVNDLSVEPASNQTLGWKAPSSPPTAASAAATVGNLHAAARCPWRSDGVAASAGPSDCVVYCCFLCSGPVALIVTVTQTTPKSCR